MKQATLVSLYGQKTKPLVQLIKTCTEIIQQSALDRVFRPYNINQIHGTLIGMEKLVDQSKHFNANIWKDSGNKVEMDFTNLLPTLLKHLPMTFRFGGFKPAFNRFNSLGCLPFERSFQIQWATNRVTLIGWPHVNGDYTSTRCLNFLRHEIAETCHINHKYKNDNDLFLVLGEISSLDKFSESEIENLHNAGNFIEKEIRDYLAVNELDVIIDEETVFIVQYEDESLSLNSTEPYCLSNKKLNAKFIDSIFI